MRRTRVVQFIPNLTVGGAEQMMTSLACGLQADGYDVKVLSFFDRANVPVERDLDAAGIEIVTLGKHVGFDPRMFTRVAAALQQLEPDVLHTHRVVFPYALPSIVNGLASRSVHTIHSTAQSEVAGRARKTSHWLAYCAGVKPVAICDYVARTIVDVYGVPPRTTIPNGIPVARFAVPGGTRERWRADQGIRDDAVVFTSIARMARPKCPDDIIDAFARIADPARRAVLVLVGDGPLQEHVARRVATLGLEGRVRLTGMRSDVPEILAATDVFVLASQFEGHPLSVMEAMAAGRAVVATHVGGVPEIISHGSDGLIVPPRDIVALEHAFQRLLEDPALRDDIGERARHRALESFDVSRMISSYERLYDEVLRENRDAVRTDGLRRHAAPRKRRHRVVQFIPNLPMGGAERMMISLAKGLDRDRYDVRALTFFHEPNSIKAQELRDAGIELTTLGKHLGFDPRMFSRVSFALRNLRPDILHTHRPVYPYALPAVAVGRLRGRVVHTVHNVAEHEVSDAPRRSTHWLAYHAHVSVVAICEFAAKTVHPTYGVHPRAIIPNGIAVQQFVLPPDAGRVWRARNGVPPDAVVFTSVARLARQKSPLNLVEAFSRIARDPRALLLFVGDGELREDVEAHVRALGVAGRVRMLGAREDVPQILAASDVFVLASHHEGHPLSVMEAMAAQLPVIATAVGGVPELVKSGETGLVVPPEDVPALAAALGTLVDAPEVRARMGTLSRQIALSQFDVSQMVERYDRLYQQILESLPASQDDSAAD